MPTFGGLTAHEREEERMWREVAPELYDCSVIHTLASASLTASWLPGYALGEASATQRLLLGTSAEG